MPGRKYEMNEAFEKMTSEFGESLANEYKENAKFIINGDIVVPHAVQPTQTVKKRKKLFGLF